MSKGIRIEHEFDENGVEIKFCTNCSTWHALTSYAVDNTRWDKLRERCKPCRKLTRNTIQEESYRMTPEQKIKKSEYDRLRVRNYPEEHKKAYSKTNRRVRIVVRNRFYMAIKNIQKVGSAIDELGCPIPHFKEFIESKFHACSITGTMMSWDNWGRGYGRWQIDHIIELHKFDLSELDQLKEACHYTNMQPLWFEDHTKKGTRPKKL